GGTLFQYGISWYYKKAALWGTIRKEGAPMLYLCALYLFLPADLGARVDLYLLAVLYQINFAILAYGHNPTRYAFGFYSLNRYGIALDRVLDNGCAAR